jgi:two-component system, NarL family, nitrate/nitrite response regulator NarL
MPDVFVVSPIRVHRETLSAALDEVTALEIVGEAETLDEALPRLRHNQRPSVALLDGPPLGDLVLAWPLSTGQESKLVAVGVPEDEAAAWLEAGASGVVPPDSSLDDLIVAVERVADDELVAPPRVKAQLAGRVRGPGAEVPSLMSEPLLTSRETEILNLVGDGLSNKEIAQRLSIQVQTVKNHVHNVLAKLGVNRRADAAWIQRRRRR